jgi:hypothetical protein
MALDDRSEYQELLADCSSHQVVAYGEVYTPLSLCEEMLDALPARVWNNPSLRWFEPACGLAPFLYIVYQRLMRGLVAVFPDTESRRKHILEQMLYFNEIQAKNVVVVREVFQSERYRLNIWEGSFFEVVPVDFKADVVVGNPPYNMNGNKSTGNIIWHKFVERVLTGGLLNPNGWLVFIHPPPWRKPTTNRSQVKGIYKLLTQTNQMLHLEMYDTKAGESTFKCGTKYDWYVVERKVRYTTTSVRDEQGGRHDLDLNDWPWLPNALFTHIATLLCGGDTPQPVLYNCFYHANHKQRVVDQPSSEYSFPLIHSTPKTGARLKYTNAKVPNDVMYGVPKVICGESSLQSVVNDYRGEYATTQGAFALPITDSNDGDMLVAVLQSPEFSAVLKACTWGNFRIDWCLFTSFRQGFWRI